MNLVGVVPWLLKAAGVGEQLALQVAAQVAVAEGQTAMAPTAPQACKALLVVAACGQGRGRAVLAVIHAVVQMEVAAEVHVAEQAASVAMGTAMAKALLARA